MKGTRIPAHDVARFEFAVEAARLRRQDRQTVTYVSDDGARSRTYPITLGNEPPDTFVTPDGCIMRKVLVMSMAPTALEVSA
jgi:hypothetical protein